MAANQDAVAQAWRDGNYVHAGAMHTNGQGLYSYDHCIGVTARLSNGQIGKIAYDCHYSVTTARHANGAKRVANETISPCPSCGKGHQVKGG